jgi:hypothetical protein
MADRPEGSGGLEIPAPDPTSGHDVSFCIDLLLLIDTASSPASAGLFSFVGFFTEFREMQPGS